MQSKLLSNARVSMQINDKKLANRHFIYYICTIKVPVSAGLDICTIKKMEGVLERGTPNFFTLGAYWSKLGLLVKIGFI